jgi:hypothetical protein
MSKDEKENRSNRHSGALDKLAPFDDRSQYEQRLNSLPAEQKEFAEESMRFADLCQYFSQQKMDIPPSIVERVGSISKLSAPDRIRAIKDINRELMEYLNDVGKDSGIRQ